MKLIIKRNEGKIEAYDSFQDVSNGCFESPLFKMPQNQLNTSKITSKAMFWRLGACIKFIVSTK